MTAEEYEEKGRQAYLNGCHSVAALHHLAPENYLDRQYFLRGWREMRELDETTAARIAINA